MSLGAFETSYGPADPAPSSKAFVGNDVFSEATYRRELDAIFRRCWVLVGHETSIPKPNDYILSCIGEDSIIIQRDSVGKVRAFLNKCRHRGAELCVYDRGNAPSFTCPYHGWTYVDGNLTGVPSRRSAYFTGIDTGVLGLTEVPQVSLYGGLIFACWDPEAMLLQDYLGEARWYLDNFLLRMEMGGLEIVPGPQKYMMPINWKLLAENFAGDDYHFAHTHGSVITILQQQSAQRLNHRPQKSETVSVLARGKGGVPHGFLQVRFGDESHKVDMSHARELGQDCVDWVQKRHDILQENLAAYPKKPHSVHVGNVFPNFALIGIGSATYAKGLILHHPRGPTATEVWVWAAVEKSAPPAMRARQKFVLMQRQAAAGIVAPDDHEIFRRIRDNIVNHMASEQPFHYGMGLGAEGTTIPGTEDYADLPGRVLPHFSEETQRAFYEYWTQMMEGAGAHAR